MDLLLLAVEQAGNASQQGWILWVAQYSYIGVFLFLLACGFGFPFPEELALVGGGYAVYQAGLIDPSAGDWNNVLGMIMVGLTGVMIGDCLIYGGGRLFAGRPEKLPGIGRHITPGRLRLAQRLVHAHGAKAVFMGRFLFGVRPVIFIVAGSMKLPLRTFFLIDGAAALVSVPISVLIGWHFGSDLERAIAMVGGFQRVIEVVVVLVIVGTAIWIWRKREEILKHLHLADLHHEAEAEAVTADETPPAEEEPSST